MMNLSFLKLRVADCPWILFDRSGVPAADDDPPWDAIAVDICSRSKGASAVGIVVLTRESDAAVVRTWRRSGVSCPPPPAALLCASRLLFDAGLAGPESIALRSTVGESEVMVIDSRNFGLSVGTPSGLDGSPLGGAYGSSRLSAVPGAGIAMTLCFGDETVDVALFDKPLSGRPTDASRVETLVVSRQELRVKRGRRDPIIAAAAALATAVVADYADREASIFSGGDGMVVQWPEAGPVFAAGAPAYCLSGEFWVTEG